MLQICISGYGKMGKMIEQLALERGHQIACILDKNEDWVVKKEAIKNADIIIDFSMPQTGGDNILKAFDLDVPIVSGTTGWHDKKELIFSLCTTQNKSLFWAPNFSIGVNLFFALNTYLAHIMSPYKQFDVNIKETHHTQKLDAPSGTAIKIAEDLINHNDLKKSWVNHATNNKDVLTIFSHREGNIIGQHEVIYASENDMIKIEHHALNREGFALGAVMAAEWLKDKKGVFSMSDLLDLNTINF